MIRNLRIITLLHILLMAGTSLADQPKVGDSAPLFSAKNQIGEVFDLMERKGKGWTVLFFYPKAGTPGCTKQACAFRDAVKVIRQRNAEVFGISADSITAQAKFHTEHMLSFDLLSDEKFQIIDQYDVRMPGRSLAARETFIIDPDLKVRWHAKDVDPALDAQRVSEALAKLQQQKS